MTKSEFIKGKSNYFNPSKMIVILILIEAYILLLFDFNASLETKTHKFEIEYHGFVWVALDVWTIVRYKSPDKPMKIISYKSTKL